MPNVKIKQLEDRISTQGVHLGGTNIRRKLEPGEVVCLEGDLFELIYRTDKVEITNDPVTRPLDYESYDEARFCSPNFKPRDNAEKEEAIIAREAVQQRLDEMVVDDTSLAGVEAPASEKPKATKPTKAPPVKKAAAKDEKPQGARARRRAKREKSNDGEKVST